MALHHFSDTSSRHFFSERVVNRWNTLDQDTTSAKTEWFQVKIRNGTKKKDGPVSGLKSAGPHGHFQSFGAAGPVSYLWLLLCGLQSL